MVEGMMIKFSASLMLCVVLLAAPSVQARSAIFFHPDGMGVNTWQALRYRAVGADGALHWDRLSHMGVYIGTMADSPVATSNGAATTHAYGVKVPRDSFGLSTGKRIRSASGFDGSIIHEAMAKRLKTALINSGSIMEPGTAAFVARAKNRKEHEVIAGQVIQSGADVILSGGERHLLPAGTHGRHGMGSRRDGRNLIEEAQKAGYRVVYTRQELDEAVKEKPAKLLGVFAEEHTFFDEDESKPSYLESAPTIAEMMQAALTLFDGQEFLMIAEEEGTDNFANEGRPEAVIDAAHRADEAIKVMLTAAKKNPALLLLTASDSDAGGLQLQAEEEQKISLETVGTKDYAGGILVRSNAPLPAVIDNTQIFSMLAKHLFGTKESKQK
jgi:alkaline phosphatase